MARRVFFSFHYQNDIWKVNVVRNSRIVEGSAAAGFQDASLWEEAKRKGDAAVKALIDRGLENTSVTCVLIGTYTAQRQYVTYEIEQSVKCGNGLLGVYLYNIKGINTGIDAVLDSIPGAIPAALTKYNAPIYTWDNDKFGGWVEEAYQKAQTKKAAASLSNTFLEQLLGNYSPEPLNKLSNPWETLGNVTKWPGLK